jgi:hypothetical protein
MLEANALPFGIEGVTVRDSEFNAPAGPFSRRQTLIDQSRSRPK